MLFDRIDHLIVPIENLDTAVEPFRRLGLGLQAVADQPRLGTQSSIFAAGGPSNWFGVELLHVADPQQATRAWGTAFVEAAAQQRGVLVLGTEDLSGAVATLRQRGLEPDTGEIVSPAEGQAAGTATSGHGARIAQTAALNAPAEAGLDVRLIQYAAPAIERFAGAAQRLENPSSFPLKRLDHLAAFTRDLDASTRFWTDVLGVPLHGEVRTPVIIVRQLKIGDAILELLGPASPDSPAAQRPSGLGKMAAFEVTDMGAAVAQARAAGFTLPDPGPGALPGTRVTTIPGSQLSGFSLQLLVYM
jgi:catechol 2,3-dioxygenase-like lactoylglutathione lyase family enzyme